MLARKERTAAEVREWLVERESDEETVEIVLSRLQEALVLDDQRFASEFARDKRNLSGWGRARIGAALSDRGVPAELVDMALEEGLADEVERACELLESRGFRLEDPSERKRALGLLSRKGYVAEDAYEAVRRVAREAGLELSGAE